MTAQDLGWTSMAAAYGALLVSLLILWLTKVKHYRELFISVLRMSVQLTLVGFYLSILFELNHPLINVAWIVLMTAVANFSVLRGSGLRLSLFAYTFPALFVTVTVVLSFFIAFVFTPNPPLDARYLIPVGGMILGNSLSRTIITLERFYSTIRADADGYAASIACGATVNEAAAPYIAKAYRVGLSPQLASMATIGLVFLPGMMTGQILGGSSPMVAIRYQIAIIIAIFVSTELASYLTIRFSMRRGFNPSGFLQLDIFKKN